ncbi:hypothetical protein ACN28S_55430 [Cystobacter fuscus]
MARMRLDTLAGETFLRQDEGVPEQGARLSPVTCGEELARLLDGALACSFSHEEPEQADEGSAVEGFLRDCAEFCDVTGLPESLRLEMEEYFGQRLDALWRLDWLVFGGTWEAVLEPGEPPLAGRTVTLCRRARTVPRCRWTRGCAAPWSASAPPWRACARSRTTRKTLAAAPAGAPGVTPAAVCCTDREGRRSGGAPAQALGALEHAREGGFLGPALEQPGDVGFALPP